MIDLRKLMPRTVEAVHTHTHTHTILINSLENDNLINKENKIEIINKASLLS